MSLKRTWTFLLEEKKTFEEVKQYFLAITLAGKAQKARKAERGNKHSSRNICLYTKTKSWTKK